MPLRIIRHTPDINDINIARNAKIEIEFNSGILPGSVIYTTVSVNDAANYTTVPGTLGLEYNSSGIANTVTFQPLINLAANSKYRVYIFKEPNSVLSTSNEALKDTYMWEFTTGITIDQDNTGSGTLPSGEAGPVYTGILHNILPSATDTIGSFYVYSTTPKNQTPDVDIDISGVVITFTGTILTSVADMSGFITLDEVPVL